jgi:hypothetical protein
VPSILLWLAAGLGQIRDDETVVFFPTCGHQEKGDWVLPIHGWIYEPEEDGRVRSTAIRLFASTIGLDPGAADSAIFRRRAQSFIVDNERLKLVSLRIGQRVLAAERSGANGHFRGELRLPAAEIEALLTAQPSAERRLEFQAVTAEGDPRQFSGAVHLLGAEGVSVISDIDDTIKISQVTDRKALLNRTFVLPFEAVPGMARLYQRWAGQGVAFHYVSSSPWQLYQPLAEFMQSEGFPASSFHLKTFRLKDSSFFDLFASPTETKPLVIEPILKQFPQRRYILVGDSGERDPEVYGAIARKFPGQVLRIFIRDVTGETSAAPRYRDAFRELTTDRWQVFEDPSEIRFDP